MNHISLICPLPPPPGKNFGRKILNVLKTQKDENAKMARETQFKQKMNMSDDEWSQFTDFAKSKSLEL